MKPPGGRISGLLEAYGSTTYRVWAPGQELRLRIGQYDAGLAKLLREAWVDQAALLTAWNPGSRVRSRELNEAAQQGLLRELAGAGHPCLSARNEPDAGSGAAGEWVEESVLALGLATAPARALASRYGQLAFLCIDALATPRLVLTAGDP